MGMEHRFMICKHCGNIVGMIYDAGVKPVCCGEPMTELVANTTDAATEKHVPVVEAEGNEVCVKVGSVLHPMSEEHHIAWIYLQTRHGGQRKTLETGKEAAARFLVVDDEPVAVFAYCNLHGLWKTPI
ncbi:desulfoferrodoxin family protein [Anaerotruncus colihominis]|uniref:Desulfoferrodoxin n=1 Tax=Anaerotruncus colihominis TaxID=169435 RepID=A0A845SUT1_9FIRM|nr:desulfoferrodoxin family protein [Anaerotruncus colihominis]MCR2024717.1 desulfoferrodoxin family protein [Anaerotruncus colihominis]NDO38220.1 desulfoferrodoxin [Anaerotruncus colihominis]